MASHVSEEDSLREDLIRKFSFGPRVPGYNRMTEAELDALPKVSAEAEARLYEQRASNVPALKREYEEHERRKQQIMEAMGG